MTSGLFIIVI